MLYRTSLSLVFCGFLLSSQAPGFDAFAGPQPIAVVIQKNPWADVMGAETPRIAIYENGDVIYSRQVSKQKREVYFYAKLDFKALSDIADHLLPVVEGQEVKSSYSVTNATDQGSALLYLRVDNKEVVTSVYGLNPENIDHGTQEPGGDLIPVRLRQLYHYLFTVDFTESRTWHPAYVEAMLWPYDHAQDQSLHWPKTWPDLSFDRALKRTRGFSIFLDGSMEADLKKFLAGAPEGGAVEIDGKTWSMAWRPTFPSEPIWRKAFARLDNH